ncbi:hypothetical protein HDU93_009318 [Gonapodya sp. JEL0774]|nr:hypothetical protein HDU93_009318 [Gonapodya sp. JEL0774]
MDATDRDIIHTALRETHEEVNLAPSGVVVLNTLPLYLARNLLVTPVVGYVQDVEWKKKVWNGERIWNDDEVREVFTMPLAKFLEVGSFPVMGRATSRLILFGRTRSLEAIYKRDSTDFATRMTPPLNLFYLRADCQPIAHGRNASFEKDLAGGMDEEDRIRKMGLVTEGALRVRILLVAPRRVLFLPTMVSVTTQSQSLIAFGVICVAILTILGAAYLGGAGGRSFRGWEEERPPFPPGTPLDSVGPENGRWEDKALSMVLAAPHLQFLFNMNDHERRVFSQYSEDGILEYIFDNIGTTDKYYVEFGTEACTECNTRYLWDEYGWDGLLMDGDGVAPDSRVIKNHMITVQNVVSLFEKYNVPHKFDLLSVDIDSVDYYVTKKILDAGYRPRVIVNEINPYFGPEDAMTVPEDHTVWGHDHVFGQSVRLVYKLMERYGYRTFHMKGVNAFSIRLDVLAKFVEERAGVTLDERDIARLLPPFHYLYRRQHPLNPNIPNKAFEKDKGKFVTPDI